MKMRGCKNEPLRSRLELANKLIAVLGVSSQDLDNFNWLKAIEEFGREANVGDDYRPDMTLERWVLEEREQTLYDARDFVHDKYCDLLDLCTRLEDANGR